jgi:hypothetical protein
MEEGILAMMIPIFGIVFGVGVAIVSIVLNHRQKVKRAELRHRERIAALEKGIELPPEPDLDAENKRTGSLKSGLMGVFVGIVLYFALRAVADEDIALFGLIPTAVGVANLIAYYVESKKNGNGGEQKRDA